MSILSQIFWFAFFYTFFTIIITYCYNNGVSKRPIMGWSGCYVLNTNVTESFVKNQTLSLISKNLISKGYTYINIDLGWIKSRDTLNGTLISDPVKFPSGMKNLGDWIHSYNLKFGLYSSRGTLQCGNNDARNYVAPGSYGYFKQDSQYMANVGADYVKLDSCNAVGTVYDAFNQFRQFGRYLNKTNRIMYYDLCNGWYYAINGFNYSNSYRIAHDSMTPTAPL